ncbi:serine hydrolase-domain-containing protein [Apodospora peruviana]|uniref:Serine hydrolase-domain-containing protein n=1 Tax=Apodospora peruviana TaxID=516989 RepID=A0AAE0IVK5_9PEZI|nr:serine hydrolase-domain-containing protein [Apodospora peruviana]
MLIRTTLCTPARSILRGQQTPSSRLSKFLFCTTSIVMMGDSAQQSTAPSGAPTPTQTPVPLPRSKGNNNGKGNANAKANAKSKQKLKEVKILMLHGYTQSGALFRAKTRALEKLMAKALAPLNLVPALIYPTGPNRLLPSDIPGYQPSTKDGGEEETDSWAWFRKDEASGNYRLLEEGMMKLAEVISSSLTQDVQDGDVVVATGEESEEEATIDGVIGFSQGGSMAAMLASAMEIPEREVGTEHEGWVKKVREANRTKALKFAVIYSGFYAVPADLAWLWEPKVKTPTLHFIGSLDTVVDESRSQGLVERCQDPLVVVHPGGHYVPVNKEWVMPLVGFIRNCLTETEAGGVKGKKDEEE